MRGTEPTPRAEEAPDRVPDEVVADLLADGPCRRVFAALAAADEPLAVGDLARAVLAREHDADAATVEDDAVATVREELFHAISPG